MIESTVDSLSGNAIILLDVRLGPVVPAAAVPVLRSASRLYLGSDLPEKFAEPLGAQLVSAPNEVLDAAQNGPVAVISAQLTEPSAAALHAKGAKVISTPTRVGFVLLEAVDALDQMYSPGGCPWSAAQTHESLRKYLLEESYELLEAIDSGDRAELRSELSDVLLQVLYHARIAASHDTDPFDIDAVAKELVDKQVARRPHVFNRNDTALDADEVHRQWQEIKQNEKNRDSAITGVALGQPALALVAKLVRRAKLAGIPTDLWPNGTSAAATLFQVAASAELAPAPELAGQDPELALRAVARQFATSIRQTEQAATQAGLDPTKLTENQWRTYWRADNT